MQSELDHLRNGVTDPLTRERDNLRTRVQVLEAAVSEVTAKNETLLCEKRQVDYEKERLDFKLENADKCAAPLPMSLFCKKSCACFRMGVKTLSPHYSRFHPHCTPGAIDYTGTITHYNATGYK